MIDTCFGKTQYLPNSYEIEHFLLTDSNMPWFGNYETVD